MSEEKKIKALLKKVKIEYLLVAVLAVIAIFIFLSTTSCSKSDDVSVSTNEYVENLEKKLEEALSSVSGAGKTQVIISLESGMQTVYATQKVTDSGKITESLVLVNGKTVVIKENYPLVRGVIIVSEGANNLTVRMALLNAASVYLNVSEDKIEILNRK